MDESEYQCKTCKNIECWLCKGNSYYDRVMESKSCNAKEHKSDIALFRDFVRFKGCCKHSTLKDTKHKYYEYRSHSGHLSMLLCDILGEHFVKTHDLDDSIRLALDKISVYSDLIHITEEEIYGMKDIIGFAFSHRQGMKWDELTHADNLYHKVKDVYLLQNNIKMPQSEIDKIRDMVSELEESNKKDLMDSMRILSIELKDSSGYTKEKIIFKPIRHVDGC